VADALDMDLVVAEYAVVSDIDGFWENLAAVLTDEVVISEAQAVGMDWPEMEQGLARLVATRAHLVKIAYAAGWLTPDEAILFQGANPQDALSAARPWIERAEQRALLRAEQSAHLLPPDVEPEPAPA
jgi:hypothetical protein